MNIGGPKPCHLLGLDPHVYPRFISGFAFPWILQTNSGPQENPIHCHPNTQYKYFWIQFNATPIP